MKKQNLTNFIKKYNLSNVVGSTLWKIKDNNIVVNFSSEENEIKGKVVLNNVELSEQEFIIANSTELLKILDPLNDELEIEVDDSGFNNKIHFYNDKNNNDDLKQSFVLYDPDIIEERIKFPKKLNDNFVTLEYEFDKEFIDRFLKSANSIINASVVALQSVGSKLEFIINYDDDKNAISNQSSFKVDCTTSNDSLRLMKFNLDSLKSILVANKDIESGKMTISNRGMIFIQTKFEYGTSGYIVVQVDV